MYITQMYIYKKNIETKEYIIKYTIQEYEKIIFERTDRTYIIYIVVCLSLEKMRKQKSPSADASR